MTLLEAAKQALEALENSTPNGKNFSATHYLRIVDDLRAAIKQAEHPLAQFINSAGINANDMPHVVIEKLEKAMLTAAPQPEGK